MTPELSDTVLIDGDVLLYAVGFASQSKRYITSDGKQFADKTDAEVYAAKLPIDTIDEGVVAEDLDLALGSINDMIEHIASEAGADNIEVVLSGDSNFRTRVATQQEYKGHRVSEKPINYAGLKEHLLDFWSAYVTYDEEADDYISYTAYEKGFTIATIDKDLDNTPGWHYNWKHDKLYYVDPVEADRNFYKQLLTGDATDNIPGLYRMTGKRATAKLKARIDELDDPAAMYEEVRGIYKDAFEVTDQDVDVPTFLTEIGRLLWMRRSPGEMWSPPGETWSAS